MALRELGALLRVVADTRGAKQYIGALQKAQLATQSLGLNTGKATELLSHKVNASLNTQGIAVNKVSSIWRDDFGRTFNTTYRQTGKGIQALTANTVKFQKTVQKGGGIMGDFTRSLKRVAVVVPIWFAFRQVFSTIFSTLSSGFKLWEAFDKAITKSTQVIHTETQSMGSAVAELTTRIRELSIDTGESMDKLAATFYRFGTVGLNFEDSMKGMESASRLAITTFGDANQIGRVLAQVYRLLGDNMDKAIPPHERMQVIGAQIFKLWKTNAFEIGELTNAFEKFLPTANAFNIGVSESLALLASLQTAGLKAGRAGRLLRTSLNKLVGNLDQVAGELGIYVNPALDNTFDILLKVLGAVKNLQQGGGDIERITNALGVFGGVRSREAGLALIALYDTLLKNLQDINPENEKYIKLLDDQSKAHEDILETVGKQLDQFRNLRKLIGQSFVQGITGSEDFAKALSLVNQAIENNLDNIKAFGNVLKIIAEHTNPISSMLKFEKAIYDAKKLQEEMKVIQQALAGELTSNEILNIIKQIEDEKSKLGKIILEVDINKEKLLKHLKNTVFEASKATQVDIDVQLSDEELKIWQEEANRIFNIRETQEKIEVKLKQTIQEQLNLLEKELVITDMQARGISDREASQIKLQNLIEERVRQYNEIAKNSEGQVQKLNSERVLAIALNKEYKKLVQVLNIREGAQEQILEVAKLVNKIESKGIEEKVDLLRTLIDHELELTNIRGASNLEIAKSKMELEELFGLDQDALSLLEKQLNIEKEITKEKIGQKNLSAESVKLYEIAQRFGTGIATDLAKVLSGGANVENLSKRAEAIFRTQFGSRYKQIKAQDYFTKGLGGGIPIPERVGIDAEQATQRIRERITAIQPKVESTINVNIDSEDLKRKVIESFLREFDKVRLQDLIRKQIENF